MPGQTLIAGGTIQPHRFVQLDPNNAYTALQASAGAPIMGIAAECTDRAPIPENGTTAPAAVSGDPFRHYGVGEIAPLEVGGDVSPGDKLRSDTDGKGVVVDTSSGGDQNVGAVALEAGAAGNIIKVTVFPQTWYHS